MKGFRAGALSLEKLSAFVNVGGSSAFSSAMLNAKPSDVPAQPAGFQPPAPAPSAAPKPTPAPVAPTQKPAVPQSANSSKGWDAVRSNVERMESGGKQISNPYGSAAGSLQYIKSTLGGYAKQDPSGFQQAAGISVADLARMNRQQYQQFVNAHPTVTDWAWKRQTGEMQNAFQSWGIPQSRWMDAARAWHYVGPQAARSYIVGGVRPNVPGEGTWNANFDQYMARGRQKDIPIQWQ